MSDMNLRNEIVRLAYAMPKLRWPLLNTLKSSRIDRKVYPSRVRFQEGKPKVFWYRQQQVHRTNKRAPVGAYVVAVPESKADAQVRVRRPVVLEWGATRGKNSWVEKLSQVFGGRTGPTLSQHLRTKRIDAVVTIRDGKPYQIVLLNVPTDAAGEVDAASIRKADATAKYNKYFKPADTALMGLVDPEDHIGVRIRSLERVLSRATVDLRHFQSKLETSRRSLQIWLRKKKDIAEGKKDYTLEYVEDRLDQIERRQREGRTGFKDAWREYRDAQRGLDAVQADPAGFIRNWSKPFEKIFGKGASEKDFMGVSGLDGMGIAGQGGFKGEISTSRDEDPAGDTIRVSLKMETNQGFLGILRREITINPDGGITIYNDAFKLRKFHHQTGEVAPKGLGARMLYSQVLQAQKIGVAKIYCNAYRGPGWYGYYVWARYGYNASLYALFHTDPSLSRQGRRGSVYDNFTSLIERGLFPPHITSSTDPDTVTMHDLMMTKGGRDWWREYGTEWDAEFDLTPDENGGPNKCVQILEAYLREQEVVRGPMDKWAIGVPAQGGSGQHEEIELTADDERAFDRVWERMRVRAVKELT